MKKQREIYVIREKGFDTFECITVYVSRYSRFKSLSGYLIE